MNSRALNHNYIQRHRHQQMAPNIYEKGIKILLGNHLERSKQVNGHGKQVIVMNLDVMRKNFQQLDRSTALESVRRKCITDSSSLLISMHK